MKLLRRRRMRFLMRSLQILQSHHAPIAVRYGLLHVWDPLRQDFSTHTPMCVSTSLEILHVNILAVKMTICPRVRQDRCHRDRAHPGHPPGHRTRPSHLETSLTRNRLTSILWGKVGECASTTPFLGAGPPLVAALDCSLLPSPGRLLRFHESSTRLNGYRSVTVCRCTHAHGGDPIDPIHPIV